MISIIYNFGEMKIKNFIVKNKKQISIYIYIYILLNFIIKSLNLILKKKNIFFISISLLSSYIIKLVKSKFSSLSCKII